MGWGGMGIVMGWDGYSHGVGWVVMGWDGYSHGVGWV